MKKKGLKYLYGTKQENKNEYEKRMKRYFISGIPCFSEHIDRTGDVKVKDDKAEYQNYPDKKYFDIPVLDIIYDANKKYKEQQNKQTECTQSFGNNRKTFNFGGWNENSVFLNPKKETNTLKSSLDFKSNNTKSNNPFKPSPLYKGLEGVYNNRPQHNRTISDSLGLGSRRIENYTNSLKTANINYNTNTVSNNAIIAKPDKQPGLYGWNPGKDYTEDLNKLKSQLPPKAASILNNSRTEIVVLKNLHSIDENGGITPRNGRYYAEKNKIYLDSKKVDERTLFSEAVHVVQDHLGMTGIGKSNLEFQEHVIKDLYYSQKLRKTYGNDSFYEHTASTDNEYIYLLESTIDEKGVLDLNKFLIGINNFIDSFQNEYTPSNSYQTPAVEGYEYNWIKLLQIFGIEYK